MRFADPTRLARRRGRAAWIAVLCLSVAAAALAPLESSAGPLKPKPMLVGAVTYVSGPGVQVASKSVGAGGDSNPKTKVVLRPLYAGNAIRATEHGWVQYTVRVGGKTAFCTTDAPDGWVVVRPSPRVFIDFRSGTSYCGTPDAGGEKVMGAGGQTTLKTTDPVFEIVVGKRQKHLKVRQGVVVVSGRGGDENAVVVGREHQTTVPAGDKPASPTKAKLTASEKAKLKPLQQALPPVTDNKAPTPKLTGPHDPSSLRTATLTFAAAEPGVFFSCALDGTDFRLCTSPQAFDHLRPDRHTFTVRATDPAGNTGTASYAWTVDGSRIAFVSKRSGDSQIYAIDPVADSTPTRLTDAGQNADPEWSPDRKRLVFHSNRDGNWQIYVMNADGSNEARVTKNSWTDRNPTWSPDGSKIAFQRDEDGDGAYDIYTMNADGTDQRRLTTDLADDIDPAWSPNGIAFASRRDAITYQIYVMNPDGSSQRRLTNSSGQDFNPAWSPDGKELAFHSNRDGVSSKIYLMNPDGTGQHPLTTTASDDFNPAWAPDGQEVVFQRLRTDGRAQIWMVNADGSSPIQLTDGEGDDFVPDW
jgi:Tol biopolymer transport system component